MPLGARTIDPDLRTTKRGAAPELMTYGSEGHVNIIGADILNVLIFALLGSGIRLRFKLYKIPHYRLFMVDTPLIK